MLWHDVLGMWRSEIDPQTRAVPPDLINSLRDDRSLPIMAPFVMNHISINDDWIAQ
jgi:hypothetical protein